jgi:hypothetical protein
MLAAERLIPTLPTLDKRRTLSLLLLNSSISFARFAGVEAPVTEILEIPETSRA